MATPETRTLTVTPSQRSLVWTGGPMHVGNVFAVSVIIPDGEDWTFEDGHTYRLTAKRVGELGSDAVSHWPVTVTGETTGTVALDLSLAALRTLIGSADWLPLQWGLDDLEYGPMGVDVAGGAVLLGNQAYRPADTSPANSDENTYTDAEIDAKIAAVQAGAFDLGAMPSRIDPITDATLFAVQEDTGEDPTSISKATGAQVKTWLASVLATVFEAAGAITSHLSAFAHGDIAANSAARHSQGTDQGLDTGGPNAVTAAQAKAAYTHSQVTTGNPHSVTAGEVGAEPVGTAAGVMSGHEASHPAPTVRDDRNEAAGTASSLLSAHTEAHPVPTSRDDRNEAAGAVAAHELAHPAPTNRDARNEAAGVAQGIMDTHTGTHPAPTTRDSRNEAAQTAATDAEVTTGTETAVRKFSPAQLKLAAETHGGSGGGTAFPTREFSYRGVDALLAAGATTNTSANCVWRSIGEYGAQTAYISQDGTLYLWYDGSTAWFVSAVLGTAGTDHFTLATLTGNYTGAGAWTGETLAVATAVPLAPNYALAGRVVRTAAESGAYAFLAVDDLRIATGAASLVIRVLVGKSDWAGGNAGSKTVLWKIRLYKWSDGTAPAWVVAETTLTSTLDEDNADPQEDSATITLSGILAAGDHCRVEVYRSALDPGTYATSAVLHGGEVALV